MEQTQATNQYRVMLRYTASDYTGSSTRPAGLSASGLAFHSQAAAEKMCNALNALRRTEGWHGLNYFVKVEA